MRQLVETADRQYCTRQCSSVAVAVLHWLSNRCLPPSSFSHSQRPQRALKRAPSAPPTSPQAHTNGTLKRDTLNLPSTPLNAMPSTHPSACFQRLQTHCQRHQHLVISRRSVQLLQSEVFSFFSLRTLLPSHLHAMSRTLNASMRPQHPQRAFKLTPSMPQHTPQHSLNANASIRPWDGPLYPSTLGHDATTLATTLVPLCALLEFWRPSSFGACPGTPPSICASSSSPFAFLSQDKKDKYFLIALFFVSKLILGPSVRVLGHDTMPFPPFAARHSHMRPFCRACQFLGVVGDVTPTGLCSLRQCNYSCICITVLVQCLGPIHFPRG